MACRAGAWRAARLVSPPLLLTCLLFFWPAPPSAVVLLNDTGLFDLLFDDVHVMDFVGALEYEPGGCCAGEAGVGAPAHAMALCEGALGYGPYELHSDEGEVVSMSCALVHPPLLALSRHQARVAAAAPRVSARPGHVQRGAFQGRLGRPLAALPEQG